MSMVYTVVPNLVDCVDRIRRMADGSSLDAGGSRRLRIGREPVRTRRAAIHGAAIHGVAITGSPSRVRHHMTTPPRNITTDEPLIRASPPLFHPAAIRSSTPLVSPPIAPYDTAS